MERSQRKMSEVLAGCVFVDELVRFNIVSTWEKWIYPVACRIRTKHCFWMVKLLDLQLEEDVLNDGR